MEVPKYVIDTVCSKCDAWKEFNIGGRKVHGCSSYARECDDVSNATYNYYKQMKGGKNNEQKIR